MVPALLYAAQIWSLQIAQRKIQREFFLNYTQKTQKERRHQEESTNK